MHHQIDRGPAVLVAVLIASAVVGSCSRPTTFPARVTSVEGRVVCVVPVDEPDRTERCLSAGVELNDGEIVGQDPTWYSTRIGRCVEVVQVADGPWGRVTGETPCPPGGTGGRPG